MIPGFEPAQLPHDAIEVGSVVDAWGVGGWLKVLPHSADPQALFSSKRWYLKPRPAASPAGQQTASPVLLLAVREAREHAAVVLARVDGIEDRDAALALRGAQIFVPRSSFPTPGSDEYYWVDLLGLQVVNREGLNLGTVSGLHPTGPHSVLVVEGLEPDGRTTQRMIPFVSAYVDSVSLQERRILVDWQPDY
jgi:16S rRNA processing protein RimM